MSNIAIAKMPANISRTQLVALLDAFTDAWSGKRSDGLEELLADTVYMCTSHRGQSQGRAEVANMLRSDFSSSQTVRIDTTNNVARANASASMVSAYVHGKVRQPIEGSDSKEAMFGGVLILSFENKDGQLLINEIKIQLNWIEGETSLCEGWRLPPKDLAWKPGDPAAVMVSELDSPWHRIPDSTLPLTSEDAMAEAWYRYAWALDQADFALFENAFSEDVEAILTPMGHLKGRRKLITTLKAFRMPWPWMQHYGAPLQVTTHTDGGVTVLLGRVIPQQTESPDGKKVYGAHYELRLAKGDDVSWRIRWMEYIPGWIAA